MTADLIHSKTTLDQLPIRDGVLDAIIQRVTYDANGDILKHAIMHDISNNGSIDFYPYEATYVDGVERTRISRSDTNGDGVSDYLQTYEMNASGRVVRETRYQDFDFDGDDDEFYILIYNDDGYVTHDVHQYDQNQDGTGDYAVELRLTYHEHGTHSSIFETIDTDLDGAADLTTREERYSDDGQPIFRRLQPDDNFDGVPDSFFLLEKNEDGTTTRIEHDRTDVNGDGTEDFEIRETVETADFVLLLNKNSIDYGADGSVDAVRFFNTADASGNTIESLNRSDWDGDGNFEEVSRQLYHPSGQLELDLREQDPDSDGVVNTFNIREWTYSEDGQWLSMTMRDNNGLRIESEATTLTYDEAGLPLNTVRQVDYNDDGVFDFTPSEHLRLADGRDLLRAQRDDRNRDGIAETFDITEWNYEAGVLITSVNRSARDFNRDQTIDLVTITKTFDGFGNEISSVTEENLSNDAAIDSIISELATYDDEGNPLRRVVNSDYNADGITDFVTYEDRFDEMGRQVLKARRTDRNENTVAESVEIETNEYAEAGRTFSRKSYNGPESGNPFRAIDEVYDSTGNLLSRVDNRDEDANGVFDSNFTITATYDSQGNQLTYVEMGDSDADGNPDSREEITSVYDNSGHLVSRTKNEFVNGVQTTRFDTMGAIDEPTGNFVLTTSRIQGEQSMITEVVSVDGEGRVVAERIQRDFNNDLKPDSIQLKEFGFHADGAKLFERTSNGERFGTDGSTRAFVEEERFWPNGNLQQQTAGYDIGFDGSIDRFLRSAEFNEANMQTSHTSFQDTNGDDVADVAVIELSGYFDDGRHRSTKVGTDTDFDGEIDFIEREVVYGEQGGEVKSFSQQDFDGDFIAEYISDVEQTFDDDGYLLSWSSNSVQDVTGNGKLDRLSNETRYENQEVIFSKAEWDYGNDGTIDFVSEDSVRTEEGFRHYSANDENFDGIADSIYETFTNPEQIVLSDSFAIDIDGDGSTDTFLSDTWVVSPSGEQLPKEMTQKDDTDFDGVYDKIWVTTNTYNDAFVLVSFKQEFDANGDGTFDFVTREETFNEQGLSIEVIERFDNDQDGNFDHFQRYSSEYTPGGRHTQHVAEEDRNQDGVIDYIRTDRYFALSGHILEIDENADGIPESVSELDGDFIVAGDATALVQKLVFTLQTVGADTLYADRALANLQLETPAGDGRAISNLSQTVASVEASADLTDVQKENLISIAEQSILFVSGKTSLGIDGDLNGDGEVGFVDFLVFSSNFGNEDLSRNDGDLDGDGAVRFSDFLILSANFGKKLS